MIIGGIGDNNVHFINELDNSTEYIIKEGSLFNSRYRIEWNQWVYFSIKKYLGNKSDYIVKRNKI